MIPDEAKILHLVDIAEHAGRVLVEAWADAVPHSLVLAIDKPVKAVLQLLDPGPTARGREGTDRQDRLDEVVVAVATKAGDAVGDELGSRAPFGGDNRCAARHRLDHHEAERLGPAGGEHHRTRPTEDLDLQIVRHVLV